jgi:hypothetical protein
MYRAGILMAGLVLVMASCASTASTALTEELVMYDSEYIEQGTVEFSSASLVVFRHEYYFSSSIDAHGVSNTTYYVVDVARGEIIGLDDIVLPGEQMTGILERFLKKQYQVADGASLTEAGFFDEPLAPPDTFSVGQDGLRFVWNRYSIAPNSMGLIELTVPYDAIDACLTAKGRELKTFF